MEHRKKFLAKQLFLGAVLIQSKWRAYTIRRSFSESQTAAITIQSQWRTFSSISCFLARKRSVLLLQAFTRRCHAIGVAQTKLEIEMSIKIQTFLRSCIFRKAFLLRKQACLTLQTCVRGFTAMRKYQRISTGIRILQALIRLKVRRFKKSRELRAALILQIFIRSVVLRQKRERSVVVLQSFFRKWKSINQRRMSIAAAIIQIWWKRRLDAELSYASDLLILAIICLQAIARKSLACRMYQRQKRAAKKIQQFFRRWKTEMTLLQLQSSAVLLHRSVKGQLTRSATHFGLSGLNAAFRDPSLNSFGYVRSVPEALRVNTALSQAKGKARNSSAIVIQSAFRRMMVATSIQRCDNRVRSFTPIADSVCGKLSMRKPTLGTKNDDDSLDLSSPRDVGRLRNFAARKIQCFYRCYRNCKSYEVLVSATVVLQKAMKVWLSHRSDHSDQVQRIQSSAANQIQQACRMLKASSEIVELRERLLSDQKEFDSTHFSAIVIQRVYKASRERTNGENAAAAIVQKEAKQLLCRKRFDTAKQCAGTSQRTHIASQDFLKRAAQNNSVMMIQKTIRQFLCKRKFNSVRLAVVIIQQEFRSSKKLAERLALKDSALLLQKRVRLLLHKKRFDTAKCAAITIQLAFRSMKDRLHHKKTESAALALQKTIRYFLCRKRFNSAKQNATRIQKAYRSFKDYSEQKKHRDAALVIQKAARQLLCRKRVEFARLQHQTFLNSEGCISFIFDSENIILGQLEKRSLLVMESILQGDRHHQDSVSIHVRKLANRLALVKKSLSQYAAPVQTDTTYPTVYTNASDVDEPIRVWFPDDQESNPLE